MVRREVAILKVIKMRYRPEAVGAELVFVIVGIISQLLNAREMNGTHIRWHSRKMKME